jgi:hypothetical protein
MKEPVVGNSAIRPENTRGLRDVDRIRNMRRANPLWGAPRSHGRLLKLGFAVAQASFWVPTRMETT